MNKSHPELNVQKKHNALKRQAAHYSYTMQKTNFKGFKHANSVNPFCDEIQLFQQCTEAKGRPIIKMTVQWPSLTEAGFHRPS